MSDKTPFEQMMQMGQDWAKAVSPALENFTPKGFEEFIPTVPAEWMEKIMGKGISPEGLDAKTRLLLALTGLVIMGSQGESQIRLTVRHLVEAGATKQEIAETIAQAAVFGGVPAMSKAMELATEVLDGDGEAA